jgi:hypothetical protein
MALPRAALAAGLVLAAGAGRAQSPAYRLTAHNPLDLARPGETVEVGLTALPGLSADDLARVAVVDAETAREALAQAVDSDGDGAFDQLVFQADFAPRQSRSFTLTPGQRRPPRKEDFRVYGRFNRERFDDFVWENDRVAHRMYGAALETWQKEPLTSSTVDVWLKRTRRLVVNDWYMVDDYHRDHGEGADFYSAGPSRGCGGSGIWAGGQLHVSRNFRQSRVLANGPIRLVFELSYLPWEIGGGRRVTEKKRITLDAGQHLNRFQSVYTVEGGGGPLQFAAGIKKPKDAQLRTEREQGWIRMWEAVRDGNGNQGCGLIMPDPAVVADIVELAPNALVVAAVPPGGAVTYHAGSAWDRGPDIPGLAEWDRYLAEWAQRVRAPLRVDVAAR